MSAAKIEKLSSSLLSKFNWRIKGFSLLDAKRGTFSDVFSVGRHKWQVKIYPKGEGKVYDHLSLYLVPVEDKFKKPLETVYNFTVTSQTDPNIRVRKEYLYKFTGANGWGSDKFMPLSELHDAAKGYIVDDSCIIQADIAYRIDDDKEDEFNPCRGGCLVKKAQQNQ